MCDPDLNEKFVAACQWDSLPGDASAWNRLLLRIRKAGKLPKLAGDRNRLTSSAMDACSAASEVAMHLLTLDYGLTLDDLLCSPQAAAEFDRLAAEFAAGHKPWEYRWAALTIRKRAKQSRAVATERFPDWLTRPLPRAISLDRGAAPNWAQPGVYVVMDHSRPIYVGETLNVQRRVEQIRNTAAWMSFGPTSVKIVDAGDQPTRYGLQSILIGRTNPVLNTVLLRPDFDAAGERG